MSRGRPTLTDNKRAKGSSHGSRTCCKTSLSDIVIPKTLPQRLKPRFSSSLTAGLEGLLHPLVFAITFFVTRFPILASRHQADTSKISSSATGVPKGRLATPYTRRQGFLSFPKTSCSNSEAASATFG